MQKLGDLFDKDREMEVVGNLNLGLGKLDRDYLGLDSVQRDLDMGLFGRLDHGNLAGL